MEYDLTRYSFHEDSKRIYADWVEWRRLKGLRQGKIMPAELDGKGTGYFPAEIDAAGIVL